MFLYVVRVLCVVVGGKSAVCSCRLVIVLCVLVGGKSAVCSCRW